MPYAYNGVCSMIYTYYNAVIELVGINNVIGGNVNGPISNIEFIEGFTNLPTEEQVQAKLKELQADYDAKKYQRDRAASYPDLAEQLDLLWHAIDDGKFNVKSKETDFYKKLKAVKDANPKPE